MFDIRSYKNGYVWNDLAENDIIYPAEGAEYVLKGSELIEGCTGRLSTTLYYTTCLAQPHLVFAAFIFPHLFIGTIPCHRQIPAASCEQQSAAHSGI